jgi:hypothetical protein
MNKSGKAIPTALVYVIAIALIGLVGLGSYAIFGKSGASQQGLGTGNVVLTPEQQAQASFSCGSDKETSVTVTLKNDQNTTGLQTFDANYYIYLIGTDGKETQVVSGSDTTGGTATLDCGNKYRLKLVTDGSTDNSRIKGVYTQNAEVDKDGSVLFTTVAPSFTLGLVGSQHSAIEVRAYNEDARARMYEAGGSNSAYVGTGATFYSVTDNATVTTVTTGSSLMQTMELRAVSTTADFNDYGVYVLVDADPNYWDTIQSMEFDGVELQDVKGSLTADESKAFSGYEFVYLISSGKLVDSKNHKLYFDALKSTGATGSDTLKIDFAVSGNFLSVDGYTLKTAGAKDSSGSPLVYNKFETSWLTN